MRRLINAIATNNVIAHRADRSVEGNMVMTIGLFLFRFLKSAIGRRKPGTGWHTPCEQVFQRPDSSWVYQPVLINRSLHSRHVSS